MNPSLEQPIKAMKRYLVFPQDFDTRSILLGEEQECWDEKRKQLHRDNKKRLMKSLEQEFGVIGFKKKVQNFKDIGTSPFSVISFHNQFFSEIRKSFVIESYYPALTGACALGERMLNHILLNLRAEFRNTPEYPQVYRKKSFDNWDLAIKTLTSWGVMDNELAAKFNTLLTLRNRSIHFNQETYVRVRADSLEAIKLLAEIISLRFGFFLKAHVWAIEGTKGAQFIKREYENDPFLKTFYLPQCPYVGPYYAVKFIEQGTLFVDRDNYPLVELSDDEFAKIFNNRQASEVANSDLPLVKGINPVGIHLHDGTYLLSEKRTVE